METTITISENGHGCTNGDVIEFRTFDMRRWKQLWHFVTFRSPPVKIERATITSATTATLIILGSHPKAKRGRGE